MTTTTFPARAERTVPASSYEEGYKAILVREERKSHLREVRASMSDRDLNQERRLATAALEMVLDDLEDNPRVLLRITDYVEQVVELDLNTSRTSVGGERKANYEEGYRPVLVREETKDRLRKLRGTLSDPEKNQERRLATAALSMVIDDATADPEVRRRWERTVREVVKWDLELMTN